VVSDFCFILRPDSPLGCRCHGGISEGYQDKTLYGESSVTKTEKMAQTERSLNERSRIWWLDCQKSGLSKPQLHHDACAVAVSW
jgi:hypothetical protein